MPKSIEVPQKIKNRTMIWSSNPTSGFIAKGNETCLKEIRFPIFIETLFTIAKTGKSPKQVSLDEQSNKENMNKYLQNFKTSTIKLLEDNTEKKNV